MVNIQKIELAACHAPHRKTMFYCQNRYRIKFKKRHLYTLKTFVVLFLFPSQFELEFACITCNPHGDCVLGQAIFEFSIFFIRVGAKAVLTQLQSPGPYLRGCKDGVYPIWLSLSLSLLNGARGARYWVRTLRLLCICLRWWLFTKLIGGKSSALVWPPMENHPNSLSVP